MKNYLRICGICCKLDVDKCEDEYVFHLGDEAITWYFLSKMFKRFAFLACLRENFTLHSLHVGAVVALLLKNCPSELIMKLGMWTSIALLDYICIPHEILCSVSSLMVGCSTALLQLILLYHS